MLAERRESPFIINSEQKYGKKRNGLQNGPRQFLSPYLKKATYSSALITGPSL